MACLEALISHASIYENLIDWRGPTQKELENLAEPIS